MAKNLHVRKGPAYRKAGILQLQHFWCTVSYTVVPGCHGGCDVKQYNVGFSHSSQSSGLSRLESRYPADCVSFWPVEGDPFYCCLRLLVEFSLLPLSSDSPSSEGYP